jgi:serine/threonine protein phosphatase 1
MRTYAIGDIHGHLDLLQEAHDRIAMDRRRTGDSEAPVVHLGDLVDRGPDSRGVVEWLANGIRRGEPWVVLKGNHDRMFTGFLDAVDWHDPGLNRDLSWLHPRLGGAETLASYGVKGARDRRLAPVHAEAVAAVPEDHRVFLKARPTSFRRGEALFVHAGIRPGIAIADQTETDLVWIRKVFLEHATDYGFLVVHGHTALDAPRNYGNRVNLDSSAAYGGLLTAAVIEGRDVWNLADGRRTPLLPQP